MQTYHDYIAKTFRGLENVLSDELISLGVKQPAFITRGVRFHGTRELLYRICFESRIALRILQPIAHFNLNHSKELYDKAKRIDWPAFFSVDRTFAVDSIVKSPLYNHSNYPALLLKDAVADHFRDVCGKRPDVNTDNPDVRLHVHISEEQCTLCLDASGDSLHKRGYRLERNEAPLNEVLAAGMLRLADWNGKGLFLDPMCGSGTLLTEAALMAENRAPGLIRRRYGFMGWNDFDDALFRKVMTDAEKAVCPADCRIVGADISEQALEMAGHNLTRAGLSLSVERVHSSFEDFVPPTDSGLMVMNPPYGQRMGEGDMTGFYRSIGDTLKKKYSGYTAWILSANQAALKSIGLRATRHATLWNGALECRFQRYLLYAGSVKKKRVEVSQSADGTGL
ncbi:MAG: hypothetical protein A2293_13590 [Elusimicrobia bacterium RIFOXYB2_FULL_49_7]|nr:MAG: hypothetical protein A2293_13590 [Elusimicrobia bacterium RIFOXYB2_FULL_49_7]